MFTPTCAMNSFIPISDFQLWNVGKPVHCIPFFEGEEAQSEIFYDSVNTFGETELAGQIGFSWQKCNVIFQVMLYIFFDVQTT